MVKQREDLTPRNNNHWTDSTGLRSPKEGRRTLVERIMRLVLATVRYLEIARAIGISLLGVRAMVLVDMSPPYDYARVATRNHPAARGEPHLTLSDGRSLFDGD